MRITPGYLQEQKRLHAEPRGYGGRGDKWANTVVAVANAIGASIVLDYGCGQNTLARALGGRGIICRSYDPAIDEFNIEPEPSDLVVCTDVLEHVEEELVDEVLAHLAALTRKQLFAVVSTVTTEKTLSDGRSAHITIKPREWWVERFAAAGLSVAENVIVNKPGKEFGVILEHRNP
jgi:hypothetical protein